MSIVVPDIAFDMALKFEGLHKIAHREPVVTIVPYYCPAGVLTIGAGHTGPDVTQGLVWSKGRALDALATDLLAAASAAFLLCPALHGASEGRIAAIVDFTFNLGAGRLKASTLRRRINANDWAAAKVELRKWVWGGGRKLPGLILRREAEAALI